MALFCYGISRIIDTSIDYRIHLRHDHFTTRVASVV